MQRIKRIKISRKDLRKIIEESIKNLSMEICGLLMGKIDNKTAVIKRIKFTPNISESPIRFKIDPLTLYETYMEAEKRGEEVVGIFHSHPSSSQPSALDIEYMQVNPVVWLIVGVRGKENYEISAWQLFEGKIQPVEIIEE